MRGRGGWTYLESQKDRETLLAEIHVPHYAGEHVSGPSEGRVADVDGDLKNIRLFQIHFVTTAIDEQSPFHLGMLG